MCVLLIGWQMHRDWPLVVAASRDEDYTRPAAPPERLQLGGRRALAPRDLAAGGTWEGVNDAGLAVVITNRRDGSFDAARPTRGALCLEALAAADATAVQRLLEGELQERRYNSFNLFYADRTNAFVSSWNGTLAHTGLRPGTHALSNLLGLGELDVPELAVMPWGTASWEELRERLVALLGSHEPRGGHAICKHGERYGTVSSSLLRLDRDGVAHLEHAAGPACRSPFQSWALPLAAPA